MLKTLTKLLLIPLILLTGALFSSESHKRSDTAVGKWEMAREEPVQTALSSPVSPITLERDDYTWHMVPRADYRIAARVLQSKQYDDWQAAFAPIDLALGWGKISERRIDRWIDWRQSDRWYYYRFHRLQLFGRLLSPDYVREHSANVHVVPATTALAAALQQLERNSLVLLEGKLVDVEAERDGRVRQFFTSLSRADQGDGSCEIMYVERLVIAGVEHP